MNSQAAAPPPKRRRILRAAIAIAVAIALYAALGFFVAPVIVKNKLEEALTQATQRRVSIERLRINPFALSATLQGFSMRERGSDEIFASFEELYVDASLASLRRLSPVLDRVRLARPSLRLVRLADGRYNVSDLIDEALKPPADPDRPPPRFSLNNIELIDGRIDFDDRPEGRKHEVTELRIGIPFISNLPYAVDIDVQPILAARINGSPLEVKGETRPFKETRETTIALDFDRIDLPRYAAYAPLPLPVQIAAGELDTESTLRFTADAGNTLRSLTLAGKAELRRLEVKDRAGAPLAGLQRLTAELEQFDVVGRVLKLAKVTIEQPQLHVARERDGSINLLALLPPDSGEKTERPLQYAVARLELSDGRLLFADRQPLERPFETDIRKLRVEAANLTNAPGVRATLKAGYETGTGATFSYDGDLQLAPVAAAGQVEVRSFRLADLFPYYESVLALQVDDGLLDAGARITLAAVEPLDLVVSDLAATLSRLKLSFPGDREPLWRLAAAEVKGGSVDVGRQRIALGEVVARDGVGNVRRHADGTLNLDRVIKAPAAAAGTAGSADAAPGWLAEAKLLRLERFSVSYEDEALPLKILVAPIAASVRNFSNQRGARSNVDLRATLGKGRVALAGTAGSNPAAGKLRVDLAGFELAPLQVLIDRSVNLAITGGALQASGDLSFDFGGERPTASFDGDLGITDFASIDKPQQESLLQFKSLRLGGLSAALEPLRVSVGEVALAEFYSRLILNADGTLNVQNLLSPPGTAAVRADGTGSAPARAEATPSPLPPNIAIGRITLAQGNVNFSDFFVRPNYSANLTGIAGSVGQLTPQTPGEVDLKGTVENTAPVAISGRINPLAPDLFLDIKASARDIELSPLTPYSSKYAGYGIEKGKLSMEVSYLVDQRKLKADNRVVLDQLTFGDKVESPDATKLPVLLAVALLKDRNGVIDIELPISGSIDDPEFSVGGIIIRVLINLITKAVTAPFALLGSLVGGGEELAYLEFAPGSAAIDDEGRRKLADIAKALADRPALKIDIAGRVDAGADREGLRKATLAQQVRAQKARELGKAADAADVRVEPAEYPKYLTAAYRAADFERPRNFIGMLKEVPVPEMEAMLLAQAKVGDEELRRLANERAQQAKNWLVGEGKIAAERVFLTAPKMNADGIKDKGRAARVDFSLR